MAKLDELESLFEMVKSFLFPTVIALQASVFVFLWQLVSSIISWPVSIK